MAGDRLTLDDEDSTILAEATRRFMLCRIADDLTRKNMLADMMFMGYVPPTRWQRFKYRLRDIGQRGRDIWAILSGGDIHESCGR